MTGPCFVDTNVLVYALDIDALHKQPVAFGLIADLIAANCLVLSPQVLIETVAALSKRRLPFSTGEIRDYLERYRDCQLVTPDFAMIRRALDARARYQLSWWDSLIVAAAERGSCKVIYSEDLNHGQSYFGIAVHNPFFTAVMDDE